MASLCALFGRNTLREFSCNTRPSQWLLPCRQIIAVHWSQAWQRVATGTAATCINRPGARTYHVMSGDGNRFTCGAIARIDGVQATRLSSTSPGVPPPQTVAPEGPSPKLVSVTRDDSAGWYRVEVDNGFTGTYPYVWLRDNCRCRQCYHPPSWQRSMLIEDLDPEVVPSSEELVDEGRTLRITWPDQHRSDFDAEWLNRQRFSDMERDVVSHPEFQVWGAEMNGDIPTFDFQKVLQDDIELYNWLDVLNTKGLALVTGAPTENGALRKLAEKVAYVKTTIYGDEFQVFSKHDASNLAYTSNSLCLHVDLPFYCYAPGVQMLHCIEQANASGGENQFVDGLNVAEQVRREFPQTYDLLRSEGVDFRDAGADFQVYHLKHKRPVIQYGRAGFFQRVNFNHHVRAPYMSLPVTKVTDMYRALKVFEKVMYREENLVQHRLSAGEIATFSNGRVLHGRSKYIITGEGNRHLEGAYFDWDEAHSRMRILRENHLGDRRL